MSSVSSAPPAHIWNGIYSTWDAACEAAGAHIDAFESDRWLTRITEQLEDYRRACAEYGTAPSPRPCTLPWLAALVEPRRIVDLGGSSGWTFDYLKHTQAKLTISSYVVVEIDRIVNWMNAAGLQGPPVIYQTIDEPVEPCDVLYCNSALQYFGSNAELLALLRRSSPRYVLLDDVLGKGDEDFFSTQAYYGTFIPHRFIGLGRLTQELAAEGYELLASAPFTSPILGQIKALPMENLSFEYQVRHAVTMLFERRPQ